MNNNVVSGQPWPPTVLERARPVKMVIFDVDGVLTDGRLFVDNRGDEYKAFYSKDGLGMKMLQGTGVHIGIITARTSEVVQHRMASLGIVHVYQGQLEKLAAYEKILAELQLTPEQTAYVGDDLVDLPVMQKVGLAIAVADAEPWVMQYAHWITSRAGGLGAARDVCELLMHAQGTWAVAARRFGVLS